MLEKTEQAEKAASQSCIVSGLEGGVYSACGDREIGEYLFLQGHLLDARTGTASFVSIAATRSEVRAEETLVIGPVHSRQRREVARAAGRPNALGPSGQKAAPVRNPRHRGWKLLLADLQGCPQRMVRGAPIALRGRTGAGAPRRGRAEACAVSATQASANHSIDMPLPDGKVVSRLVREAAVRQAAHPH